MSIALRNFDNWNRYLDNKGQILHGKVYFCYKDSLTVAPIYNSDGTSLANPIFTDIYGRTSTQVFLESGKDVLVYFYKWVGDGSMTDDDPSKWSLQYTSESMNAFSLDFGDFNAAVTVSDVDSLRALDPELIPSTTDGNKIVCLLGYYESGDKEPIYYTWNPSSNVIDNAGSVIAYNDSASGRWIMVDPSYVIDSRHFGIFPHEAFNDVSDDTVQIVRLMEYANDKGLHTYFAGGQDAQYFNVSNYTIRSDISMFVNKYTRFKCTGDVVFNIDIEGSSNELAVVNSGSVTINCTEGYTAWVGANGSVNASNIIHINSDPALAMTYSDIICYITSDCSGNTFNRCQIFANGVIASTNTWNSCAMKESFFTDTSKVNQIFYNCSYPLEDWPTTSAWIYYKNSEGSSVINFGDMQGRTIDSTCSITAQKWIMSNAVFDSPSISVSQSVTLSNCTGTISLDALNQSISLDNCNLSGVIKGYNINVKNSTVQGDINGNLPNSVVEISSSRVTSAVYANGSNSILHAYYSTFEEVITAMNIDVCNCTLSKDIDAVLSEGMYINFRNNIINGQFVFVNTVLSTTDTAVVLSGNWISNTCYHVDGLINWNNVKSYFKADDSVHTYTYTNNSEPSKNTVHSYYAQAHSNSGSTSLTDAIKLTQSEWYNAPNGTIIYERFTTIEDSGSQMHVYDYVPRLTRNTRFIADIFAIGTVNISARVLRIESVPVFSSTDDSNYIGPTGFQTYYVDVKTSGKSTVTVPVWDGSASVSFYANDLYWDTSVNAYCYCPCYAYGSTYETSQCGLGTLSFISFNRAVTCELPLPLFDEADTPSTVKAIRMRCYEL